MKHIVVLISGRGSNLQALLDAARQEDWEHAFGLRVAAVLSNRVDAPGLACAREARIPTRVLPHDDGACDNAEGADRIMTLDSIILGNIPKMC